MPNWASRIRLPQTEITKVAPGTDRGAGAALVTVVKCLTAVLDDHVHGLPMKGAVDFMPATLSKAVQGERRRGSPPRDLRVTIFGTTLREGPA